jgi:hypothetical protein
MPVCQPPAMFLMTSGSSLNKSCPLRLRMQEEDETGPMTAPYSMACCTCCGGGVRGARCPERSLVPGKRCMIALRSGSGPRSLSRSGRGACICMIRSRGLSGSGSRRTGLWCGLRWGEKEAGPNPTDRGKPGYKEHLWVDGRGVPLSTVSTAANVNDGPMLAQVLTALPLVRPQPDRDHPQPLCLDAAFDNAPAREVVWAERYTGHIAPKGGRTPEGIVRSLKKSWGRLPMISGGDVQRRIRALGTTNGEQTESGENQEL